MVVFIVFQIVVITVFIASIAVEMIFFTFSRKPSMKLLNPSQLSQSNFKAPANGFTKRRNRPCKLFFTKSMTPVKKILYCFHDSRYNILYSFPEIYPELSEIITFISENNEDFYQGNNGNNDKRITTLNVAIAP